jgi:hypothetical protein
MALEISSFKQWDRLIGRVKTPEIKFMRRTLRYSLLDHRRNGGSRDSSVGIATGYRLDVDTMSRSALGPIQPLIQWVLGALSLGVKRPGRESDHLHLVPRSKNAWSYTTTPPIRLHGVILSYEQRQLDFLEEMKVFYKSLIDPVENKLAQGKQKCLNHVSRMEDIRYPHNSLTIDLSVDEDLDDHQRDYWTDTVVRPKQVIYWAKFVSSNSRRRICISDI